MGIVRALEGRLALEMPHRPRQEVTALFNKAALNQVIAALASAGAVLCGPLNVVP